MFHAWTYFFTYRNSLKFHKRRPIWILFVKLKIKRVVLFTEQNILQPDSAQLNQDTWILINQLNGDLGPLDDGQQGIDHRGYEGIDEAL